MGESNEHCLDLGGTIRALQPSETLARIEPLFDKLGITRIANVSGLDTLNIPVAICIRPNAKHLSVSQGKGTTWELAKTSAAMESIEGYHAENPKAPALHGSFAELNKNYPVIYPNIFQNGFFRMNEPEKISFNWAEALDLANKKTVFIPHALSSLDTSYPRPEFGFLAVSSNGLASGNTINEAILHGICEIIERDSTNRWGMLNYELQKKTQLRLETIKSKINRGLIDNFISAGLQVKVWDATQEIGMPTFRCAIFETNALRKLGAFYGSGAHPMRDIALARALTEAARSRLTLITGSRDDVFISHYQMQTNRMPFEIESEGERDFIQCTQIQMKSSFAENIDELIIRLSQKSYKQIFMIDHTKPEIMVPVVHVFIPGMQFTGSKI